MFRKIRFYWRLLVAFLRRRGQIILLSFVLGILAFFFLPRFTHLIPKTQQTRSIGLVGRWNLNNIPESIQILVSDGLTKVEDDGSAMPALAREWLVKDEGKTYVFKLEEGRFWHDGSKVTAKDINYNFKDAAIEIIDEQTIQFKLKEPFAPFPVIVSRPVFKKGFIGTGQYKVEKITRNGEFVEALSLQCQDKKKPNLKYHFYPTESAAKIALKLGEVKILEDIIDPSGFDNWQNIETTTQVKPDHYLAIFFDTDKPYLSEKNFRQALAYALPKDKNRERVFGPIIPSSWAYSDDVKPYEYNLENAKKLLEKIIEKDKKIAIKLATSPSLLAEGEKIRKAWETLGVIASLEPLIDPSMDFEALLAIQEVPPDPDQYILWHSSQEATNITHFKNPRIDQLLEEGRKTQDAQKRKRIYLDFQRFLVEEVPAIFLYHPVVYQISRK